MRTEPVPVFVNARAGAGRNSTQQLRDAFGDAITPIALEAAGLRAAVAEAASRGTPIVGVAGGDGSLNAAADALVDTDTALLCVPTGTLNNFSQRIGIANLAQSAAALREGRIETVSVGSLQDRVFLNTLTFGEYARVVRLRERLRGVLGKWPAAGVAFMVAAGSQHRISVTLQVGGYTIERRTRFVWVGLGWGSFPRVQDSLERRAEPDLEVAILHTDTRREGVAFLMRLAAALLRGGGPVRDPELEIVHGRSVALDSPHRIDATADGEPLRLHTPVQLGVRDRALRVVAGESYRIVGTDLVDDRRTS